MKIVISGTRDINDAPFVKDCIEKSRFRPTMTGIITGGSGGVDTIAYWWARLNGIPCSVYHAQWNIHHEAAGPIRNHQMIKQADGLIAIWDGLSPGTANAISQAERKGISIEVWNYPPGSGIIK